MKIEELKALLEQEQAEVKDLAAVNGLLDKVMGEETTEEKTEEATEEVTEEETPEEGTSEETPEEETSEEETPEEEASEEEKTEEKTVELSAVLEEIVNLRTQVATLTARLAESEKALATKEQQEAEFITKFKNLSVSLKEDTQPKKMPVIGMTNGIGEG